MDGFWTSTKAWVIGVAVGMVVVIGACGGAVAYGFLKASDEAVAGKDVLASMMLALAEGDVRTAYTYFSEDLQAEASVEEFETTIQQQQSAYSGFSSLKTESWFVRATVGQKTELTYGGRVGYSDGSAKLIHAILLKEDGSWKVRAFRINPLPVGLGPGR